MDAVNPRQKSHLNVWRSREDDEGCRGGESALVGRADGLRLVACTVRHAAQVSLLRTDGNRRRRSGTTDGATLQEARCRKEWMSPGISATHGCVRHVVLAAEVCRR